MDELVAYPTLFNMLIQQQLKYKICDYIVTPLISIAHTAGLSFVPPAWIQCLPSHLSLHCPPCSLDYCLWFPPFCSSCNHCYTLRHLVSCFSFEVARSCYTVHIYQNFLLVTTLPLSHTQCSLHSPTQSAYSF